MSKSNEDSKFTPASAEAQLKGKVKIEGKVITVPKSGLGLKALAALDYLCNFCGGIAKFEHEPKSSRFIPLELRGTIHYAR